MKKLLCTAAILSFAVAAPALAADVEYKSETTMSKDADGDMKSKTETTSTDAAGTDRKDVKKVTVDVDKDGDSKKTVETDSKVDPKGLFNTEEVETKDTVETDDGVTTTKHKKEVNGKTVEDTETKN